MNGGIEREKREKELMDTTDNSVVIARWWRECGVKGGRGYQGINGNEKNKIKAINK